MQSRIRIAFAAAILLGSCGGSESLPPFSTQTVGPEGGTFALSNGFTLIVPAGAVDAPTSISLRELTEAERVALTNNGAAPEKRFLGGFFAQPDGLTFAVPIQVVVPLERPPSPGALPVLVTADRRNRSYVAPMKFDYDPDAGTATLELTHFCYDAMAEEDRAAAEYCSNPETACRCGLIHVESSASDFMSGDCQSVSDTVSITFYDCPGSPTETSTLSDESAGCDDEDDTGPPPGPPGEQWHGVLTVELEFTAPPLDPDGASSLAVIKSFHDTTVYDFEFDVPGSGETVALDPSLLETHNISWVPFDHEVVPCGRSEAEGNHVDTVYTSTISVNVAPPERTTIGLYYERAADQLDGLGSLFFGCGMTPCFIESFHLTVETTKNYDDRSVTRTGIIDSTWDGGGSCSADWCDGVLAAFIAWDSGPLLAIFSDPSGIPELDGQLTGDRLPRAPLEAGTTAGSGTFVPLDSGTPIGTFAYSYTLELTEE